jgi:hypothetical protein
LIYIKKTICCIHHQPVWILNRKGKYDEALRYLETHIFKP